MGVVFASRLGLENDVRESKTVLDSGLHTPWIPNSNYWIPDLSQWNVDPGFQLLVGFGIPTAVFRIPSPRITTTM